MTRPQKPLRNCEHHAQAARRSAWTAIALALVSVILSLGSLIGLW